MSNNTYKIRIIYQKSKFVLSSDGCSTLYEIKRAIAKKFELSASNIHFLVGEELKSLEFPDQTLLCNSGILSGETITLQIKVPSRRVSSRKSKFSQTPDVNGLIMVRRLMPADNSCLFNSIGYALESKTKSYARYLRQIVASYIESDPEKYNEVLLERPNEEYRQWILDDLNWGGAVETEILSRHYGVEICTVDILNLNFNIFGIDQNYEKRIYLLYDGSHYDAIARNISEDMDEDMDVTVFRTTDRYAYDGAMMLATEINYRKQMKKQAQNYENQYNACSKKIIEEANVQRPYPQPPNHINYNEISS